jgi:hypothetical protein
MLALSVYLSLAFANVPGGGLRGATPRPYPTSIELAFSSGRHSFSRSLLLAEGDTAGSLLAKVSNLIGISPDFLVLWKGGTLLDEVFLLLKYVYSSCLSLV